MWQELAGDDELMQRLHMLVDWTQAHVDPSEHPWVADRADVMFRWQHTVELTGRIARTSSHPLFSKGGGWSDKERVREVLAPIAYRSFEASFVENALLLTHALTITQQEIVEPGLSIRLNLTNNRSTNQNPEYADMYTTILDLRDMAEPTHSVIGAMTLEEYGQLSVEERKALRKRLFDLQFNTEDFGKKYGWSDPPQKQRYEDERNRLDEYAQLLEFGTTDRTDINSIREQRKAAEITKLRTERPDFGKLPKEYQVLSDEAKGLVGYLFEYFDEMRDSFEEIFIDTYSLGNTLGFTEKDLDRLKAAQVLIDEKPVLFPDGYRYVYKLATAYYECWVSRHYPAEASDEA